jgi:DNA-binding MarR family transcriptional regulator
MQKWRFQKAELSRFCQNIVSVPGAEIGIGAPQGRSFDQLYSITGTRMDQWNPCCNKNVASGMGEILKNRLKMSKFEGPVQEAMLALMVAGSELRSKFDQTLSAQGLTGEQYNILRILRGQPEGHQCGEIAERMIDRSPDVTRRIDSLEKQGLVERAHSTVDRRVVNVRITKKGREMLSAVEPKMKEFQEKVAQSITAEDLRALVAICEKFMQVS